MFILHEKWNEIACQKAFKFQMDLLYIESVRLQSEISFNSRMFDESLQRKLLISIDKIKEYKEKINERIDTLERMKAEINSLTERLLYIENFEKNKYLTK